MNAGWKNYDSILDTGDMDLVAPYRRPRILFQRWKGGFSIGWSPHDDGIGYRGSLHVKWQWPRLVWRYPIDWDASFEAIHAATWTGRTRELSRLEIGGVGISIASPSGLDWSGWWGCCPYCKGSRGVSYYDPEYGLQSEACPNCNAG